MNTISTMESTRSERFENGNYLIEQKRFFSHIFFLVLESNGSSSLPPNYGLMPDLNNNNAQHSNYVNPKVTENECKSKICNF